MGTNDLRSNQKRSFRYYLVDGVSGKWAAEVHNQLVMECNATLLTVGHGARVLHLDAMSANVKLGSFTMRIFALVVLLVVGIAQAQDAEHWHGHVLGLEIYLNDSAPQRLTYTDLGLPFRKASLGSGKGLTYLYDPKSATVYTTSISGTGPQQGFVLEVLPLSNGQRHTILYPPICHACPSCAECHGTIQMALSPDGRYLFTLVERIQAHRMTLPPGTFANDDDASFVEQVITVFDTANLRFLDQLVTTGLGNPVAYRLLASPDSGHFDILLFHPGPTLFRWSVEFPSKQASQSVGKLSFNDQSFNDSYASQVVEDPVNRRHLLIRGDGAVVEVRDGLKRIGTVSAVISTRRMYSPSITGDGKLLVIPTGPAQGEDRFVPPVYIDQIDTYDLASLTRVRSLRLQRPILQIRPNQNGTELYALPAGGRTMLILDAATLWQKREYVLEPPICEFTVIP
jgi:hypothetical protein